MDIAVVVSAVYSLADDIINRCHQVKQCSHDAQRIELRMHNLVGTLESAAATFRDNATLMKSLVELHEFLGTLVPILERCERPVKIVEKARQLAIAPALTKALQRAEITLRNLCDDLGLAMLPSIAERLDLLAGEVLYEMDAVVSAAMQVAMDEQEAKTRQMLKSVLGEVQRDAGLLVKECAPGRRLGRISWDDLVVEKNTVLGEGSFGVVCAGTYMGRDVAIKKAVHAVLPKHVANEFRCVDR